MQNEAAIRLGEWLKSKRQEKKIIARVFAGKVRLTPAEYAEVEAGLVHWINARQELLIVTALQMDYNSEAEFADLLNQARRGKQLKFSDRFTKAQLAPMRCCDKEDQQLTPQKSEQILEAVFTELTLQNA
jgi:hypothetical protein